MAEHGAVGVLSVSPADDHGGLSTVEVADGMVGVGFGG